ncbi:MAG: hypothetical protein ACI84O_000287 [Myxococcota bacterium]|jgi:hypothetical protein
MINPARIDFSQLKNWLVENSDAIEPGLSLYDERLDLGVKLSVPVYGIDALGRPCLCIIHPILDSTVFEKMLEAIAQMQTQGRRFSTLFPRPSEPRIFLITASIAPDLRQSLDLLTRAFPLRTFVVSDTLVAKATNKLHLEDPINSCRPHSLSSQLEPGIAARANRLMNAAESLQPPILMQGHDWPIIFVNESGPIAALFADEDKLLFVQGHALHDNTRLLLENDEVVDTAIDYLLRCQINAEPAKPEAVTIG